MNSILWILGWLAIGSIGPILFTYFDDGDVTVGDIGVMVMIACFGPLGLALCIWAYIDENQHKVVIKRKK